ncbi:hypothetical protein DXG01_009674 [Tephrocybe rancida]|nr:hypothetical protein DXG01_009674 [Tephrocybe rancida]
MKFISLASLSIFALSLVLPISAAPAKNSKNAQKVIDYIDGAKPTDLNPSCFWSGYTTLKTGGKKYAEGAVAKWSTDNKLNCHLITEVVAKAKVKVTDLTPDDWKVVSKAFAGAVEGQVNILLGKEVSKDSVWKTDEEKALNDNKKVTGIGIWEIETDGKIIKISK